MHNSLKLFRNTNKESLFAQVENFMATSNVSGMSISIELDGNEIVALLGYVDGNEANLTYKLVSKEIGQLSVQTDSETQDIINNVANEMGSFVCQSVVYNEGLLSIAFLIAN